MINIKCKCNESFHVTEENMEVKQTLICPNCGQIMDSKILNSLVSYSKSKLESKMYIKDANRNSIIKPKDDDIVDITRDWEFSVNN